MTTGAFYRHFTSKAEFFTALFEHYGQDLEDAFDGATSFRGLAERWVTVARQHRGVVRAAQELGRVGSPESAARARLREHAGERMNVLLNEALGKPISRPAALVISDILSQYVLMESAGWIPEREPKKIAIELERLVTKGLYNK